MPKIYQKCYFKNCANNVNTAPNCRFYQFPGTNRERVQEWITLSGNEALRDLTPQQLRNRHVCSDHFPANIFFPSGNLFRTALPYAYNVAKVEANLAIGDTPLVTPSIDGANRETGNVPCISDEAIGTGTMGVAANATDSLMAGRDMSLVKIKEEWPDDNDPCSDPLNTAMDCGIEEDIKPDLETLFQLENVRFEMLSRSEEEIKTEPRSPQRTADDIEFAQCWINTNDNDTTDSEIPVESAEDVIKIKEFDSLNTEFPVQSDPEGMIPTQHSAGEIVALHSEKFAGCPSRFPTEKLLADDLTSHGIEDNKITSASSLKRLHKCHVCSMEFKKKSSLTAHIQICCDMNQYHCEVCEDRFMSKELFKKHMLHKHTRTLHQCLVCNKIFLGKCGLSDHLNTHTAKKNFKCPICLKRFKMKRNLKKHMGLHVGFTF